MLTLLLLACSASDTDTGSVSDQDCDTKLAMGWTETSHAKGVDGQAESVFPEDQVPRMDIKICASAFEAMQEELTELYGEAGSGADGGDAGGPGGGGPGGGGPGGGGPGGGGGGQELATPSYQAALVGFGDQTWPQVGVRYKGNSSLSQAWQQGSEKLPFRLKFDHYEEEVEEVDNQRFFGFKDLKFSSAFSDDSLIRDKLASDTFREAGVPAARGGFMQVYVDVGAGPEFWGVYTVFEDPAGEMLDDWFGGDDGNAYKPEGGAASLAYFDAQDFEKKTNSEAADFSDVEALISALNASTSSAEEWRAELESTFEVDAFLRYLALNNLLDNWDSYGNMTHNYYLYGDPELDGRLTWIPWDFNMSYGFQGAGASLSFGMEEVGADWPLIRRLMDDPVYSAVYREHLQELLEGSFSQESQDTRIQAYHDLIAPYAELEEAPFTNMSGKAGFEDSAAQLSGQVAEQIAGAESYLE